MLKFHIDNAEGSNFVIYCDSNTTKYKNEEIMTGRKDKNVKDRFKISLMWDYFMFQTGFLKDTEHWVTWQSKQVC